MIVAGFTGPEALRDAVRRLRAAGVEVETRTPYALPEDGDQDEDGDKDGRPGTRIPLIALLAGLGLGAAGFAMQCYATMYSYPLLIGGRPDFFWTSYLVYALECGVLGAVAAAFGAFLIANRLPRLWEPGDESEALRAATRDGWFLVAQGPAAPARAVLRPLNPAHLEEVGA